MYKLLITFVRTLFPHKSRKMKSIKDLGKSWVNPDNLPPTLVSAHKRILFVLKDRTQQLEYSQSYGLHNSATMVAEYLETFGNCTKVVTVIDANFIDAQVFVFKPDIVVIEALWVTGKKLEELVGLRRYKNIQWVVRVHSNVGFLSVESRAYKYIHEYIDLNRKNVIISFNNKNFNDKMTSICKYGFTYLPNIIKTDHKAAVNHDKVYTDEVLNIGCFGSPRVLKNQLFQATCAILAADKMDKRIHFHINGDIHNPCNPVLNNIRELFEMNKHKLTVHGWLSHDKFERLINKMDLGLQISFTESFNIVVADFVVNDVPILVGKSIEWMPDIAHASTTDFDDLVDKIIFIVQNKRARKLLVELGNHNLLKFNSDAKKTWKLFLK
jgi:hypothetical protein